LLDSAPDRTRKPAPAAPARRQYRIVLRGECRHLLAELPGDYTIASSAGWTCVTAVIRDDSELYGLLDRFQDFALHLVSLTELGADGPPARWP
jgi:hypothetical protein